MRTWLRLEHLQLNRVGQLARKCPLGLQVEGLPRGGQISEQNQPSIFWDCPQIWLGLDLCWGTWKACADLLLGSWKDQVWVGISSVLHETIKVYHECSIFKVKWQHSFSSSKCENLRAAVIVLVKVKGSGTRMSPGNEKQKGECTSSTLMSIMLPPADMPGAWLEISLS